MQFMLSLCFMEVSLVFQVHKILKGLPPIRSLFAVGSGAAKLVTLPVMNYRKDKRLLKGIQRGTNAVNSFWLLLIVLQNVWKSYI